MALKKNSDLKHRHLIHILARLTDICVGNEDEFHIGKRKLPELLFILENMDNKEAVKEFYSYMVKMRSLMSEFEKELKKIKYEHGMQKEIK